MTLPKFWTIIFEKQIVWDEWARGRDKLAQRWVQRLRFSDTHLGLANLAQLLINAVTVQVKWARPSMSGNPTYQAQLNPGQHAASVGLSYLKEVLDISRDWEDKETKGQP